MGIGEKLLKKAVKSPKKSGRDRVDDSGVGTRLQDKAKGKSKSTLKRAAKSAVKG